MKNVIVALLLLVSSLTAQAVELGPQPDGSVVVKIPAQVVQACNENGGCNLINAEEFMQAVQQVIEDHKPEICSTKEVKL